MQNDYITGPQTPDPRPRYKPSGAATAIGSLPHTDANAATDLMINSLSQIPAWPQLPKRSFKENMYTQYTQGFPAVVIDEVEEKLSFNTDKIEELEQFYQNFLDENIDYFEITPEYSAGLEAFAKKISALEEKPVVLKGQVTGPISFGLTVRDQNDKAIIYNEQFADVIVKGIAMKAKWQEKLFNEISPSSKTLIFFDEPYLVSLGSAFVALSTEDVISKLDECFSAVEGFAGIHVCGGTDWGQIMKTKVDLIHFDAYEFFESITLYPEELGKFLEKGGMLGWGITPHTEKIETETAQSLFGLLVEKVDRLVEIGINKEKLLEQLLVAPSCGAGSLSIENATRALQLTKEVSALFTKRFFA